MSNELLFGLVGVIDLLFILLLAQFGKNGLTLAVVVNLILVSTFGSKLISLFGFTTNVTNVFYAVTFLASNLMTEYFGRKQGFKLVLSGLFGLLLFVFMTQLVLFFSYQNSGDGAFRAIFSAVPRIATASVVAYLCAHTINVWFFSMLKEQTLGKALWLRHNLSQFIAEGVDSVIFFSIAFWGVLEPTILIQSMFIGFVVKVLVGIVGTPLVYLSTHSLTHGSMENKKEVHV